jgi:hypothetical protein
MVRPLWFAFVLTALGGPALAEETRLAVVDMSPEGRNEKVAASVESDVLHLRPGARLLDDLAMRRLLATGEGPAAAATRLTHEAQEQMQNGECAAAVDKATQAETLTLSSVSLDDEREMLRNQYSVLVVCQAQLGHAAERDAAALRLRNLVSLPPPSVPAEIWQKYVATAAPGAATTELAIDSDPANAQIAVNFHGEGVTPHTLKVAPGTIYIEVQKEGYLKAFRKLQVGTASARAVFRLIDRTHDRLDQALATVNVLRRADPGAKPSGPTLSRLAQLARADVLVLISLKGDRAKVWFFDADRGALSNDVIDSAFDPATGRLAVLAARVGNSPAPATTTGPVAAPVGNAPVTGAAPEPKPVTTRVSISPGGTPEPQLVEAPPPPVFNPRKRPPAPWWSWLIAAAIGGALATYIYLDRPQHQGTLGVRATWTPPSERQ